MVNLPRAWLPNLITYVQDEAPVLSCVHLTGRFLCRDQQNSYRTRSLPPTPPTPPPRQRVNREAAWLKHVHNCVMWCLRDIFFFVPHIGWWDQHPELHESHHNGFVLYEIGWDINLFIHYVDFCTFSQHCLDEYIMIWCFLLLPSTIHIIRHQYHEVNLFQSYLNRPLRQTIDLFD